ncbi:hypothetical protein C725_1219 [Pacificimonas flava]|uniref:Uncharacterized protein n=1 Tax=Pacificimonas flava TaxID=1234595 RepID=M2U5N9_9SPHN|nr:hypothetical protein C725_1219 [Pacificimonas flava]
MITAHRGRIRFGCYVPTRDEVATQSAEWLQTIIIDWWWESPPDPIPVRNRSTV